MVWFLCRNIGVRIRTINMNKQLIPGQCQVTHTDTHGPRMANKNIHTVL